MKLTTAPNRSENDSGRRLRATGGNSGDGGFLRKSRGAEVGREENGEGERKRGRTGAIQLNDRGAGGGNRGDRGRGASAWAVSRERGAGASVGEEDRADKWALLVSGRVRGS